jgi:uncharacterized protein
MSLKETITANRIAALKAKDSARSQVISSILAAVKQVEVDTRTTLEDDGVLTVLNKMVKQRLDSVQQFTTGNRLDLVEVEEAELKVIREFLPTQASDAEIEAIVAAAIAQTGATSQKEMGKVMGLIKPQLNGKANMSKVSQIIKSKLS